MVSALIHLGLVNTTSHSVSVQSSGLVMTLAQHFVPGERVVKSVIGEIIFDLWPNNIEKIFHLLREDQFIRLTYEATKWWYREHLIQASKIIQSSYLIEKTPLGKITRKVDMTRGYMREDIGYSIILFNRVMGLHLVGHLNIFMVHFIETIKMEKMPLDWATTLSENLCE